MGAPPFTTLEELRTWDVEQLREQLRDRSRALERLKRYELNDQARHPGRKALFDSYTPQMVQDLIDSVDTSVKGWSTQFDKKQHECSLFLLEVNKRLMARASQVLEEKGVFGADQFPPEPPSEPAPPPLLSEPAPPPLPDTPHQGPRRKWNNSSGSLGEPLLSGSHGGEGKRWPPWSSHALVIDPLLSVSCFVYMQEISVWSAAGQPRGGAPRCGGLSMRNLPPTWVQSVLLMLLLLYSALQLCCLCAGLRTDKLNKIMRTACAC